ncbi:Uncharacterized [Syntrophomonas zehnderi OL-4]|uniref:Uncharacterized n=1 Tax=Syntrophomonas zehnderi OL-4 TaxID=690567 RepID=A0A0E4G8Z7_9FIRM|nr:hypothetical protein [Syntrophomonas zehnderi]CFX02103.1 Uncharacterized [Syntrophomonas zehnderi OL-4]
MQLQPGERSILAYFTNEADALNAVTQLKSLGITDARVDRISNYTRMGGTAVPTSIASLTTASNNPEDYRSFGPLLAASPVVSGYAHNGTGGFTHMIALVTDDTQSESVLQVLKNNGAQV